MARSLFYRRPSRVTSTDVSPSGNKKRTSIDDSRHSVKSYMSSGIPEALSFDRIVNGGACPPCTTCDFMNYLKYIEYSAENLQFYLWFKNYSQRFELLPENEKALSPEFIPTPQRFSHAITISLSKTPKQLIDEVEEISQYNDSVEGKPIPASHGGSLFDSEETPSIDNNAPETHSQSDITSHLSRQSDGSEQHNATGQIYGETGVEGSTCTTQPYRAEITRIMSIYLAEDGPRELNLSAKEKQSLLNALQATTHPSAFRTVLASVEYTLRHQAHPNFIRWTICNGNRPRVIFARGLGVSCILLGLIADLLITLSSANRAWRVLPFLGWFIGIATLIAAWKGMCVVLHGLHHRHLRPWELFAEDEEKGAGSPAIGDTLSQESLLSRSTNSFEDEPWVPRYTKRNLIRKVFDREVWIQEPALRQIQDTIFLQAVVVALLLSGLFVGIFCAVPSGKLY